MPEARPTSDTQRASRRRRVPDSVPQEQRLDAAVEFIQQNLARRHWRVRRAVRMFGVPSGALAAELARRGTFPSPVPRSPGVKPRPMLPQEESGSPPLVRYCPICREERRLRVRDGGVWGQCEVCGTTIGGASGRVEADSLASGLTTTSHGHGGFAARAVAGSPRALSVILRRRHKSVGRM